MRLDLARAAAALLILAACEQQTAELHPIAGADAARGRGVIMEVGCASCHVIPGIDWPRGRVGPSLDGFAARTLIAGRYPNRPDVLAGYVQNAPAYTPDSGMPPMPLSDEQAADVAAYLYTLRP